jgi:hypothetical protein
MIATQGKVAKENRPQPNVQKSEKFSSEGDEKPPTSLWRNPKF